MTDASALVAEFKTLMGMLDKKPSAGDVARAKAATAELRDLESKMKSHNPPNWAEVAISRVDVHQPVPPARLADLKVVGRVSTRKTREDIECQIGPYPFAKGGVRFAYHARIKGKDGWKNYVAKRFLDSSMTDFNTFASQIEQSNICAYLADLWAEKNPGSTFKFIESMIIHDKTSGLYYNLEKALPSFQKWTNNAGYALPHVPALLHFSKWTYTVTDNYLMVTDLQGSMSSSGGKIFLTDPAILCVDASRFQPTNLCPEEQIPMCLSAIDHALRSGLKVDTTSTGERTVRGEKLTTLMGDMRKKKGEEMKRAREREEAERRERDERERRERERWERERRERERREAEERREREEAERRRAAGSGSVKCPGCGGLRTSSGFVIHAYFPCSYAKDNDMFDF